MKYFVTGATGMMGKQLVDQLAADGHDVIALTRSRSNASHLPDETTVVEGDITEKESMREPMAGVDGIFHMAGWVYIGPGPDNVKKAERINVEGTRNVLELMDELGIDKGVYTSTTGLYADASVGTIDESYTPDPPSSVYLRTKWRAHYEVAKPMIEDGLPLVIVLPGNTYGPWDKPYGTARGMFLNYLKGNFPVVPRNWPFPYDHAADTAQSHILAMEKGDPGEEYIVAGDPLTLEEVFAAAEAITGVPAPRAVSPRLFSVLASMMRLIERVTTPPEGLESEALNFLGGSGVVVDNSKAKRELGIEHRPLEDGLRDYFEWEQTQPETELQIT